MENTNPQRTAGEAGWRLSRYNLSMPASEGDGYLIANFDELAVIEARSRAITGFSNTLSLTICPTMGCNFDCPYCF